MKKRNFFIIGLLCAVVIIFAILFIGTNKKTPATNHKKLNIVTTIDIYSDIASKVAGDKATTTSIINKSSIDPHDFEPTTATTTLVENSDLVINNGLGYDTWVNRLIGKKKNINVGKDVVQKKNGDNPHLWYNYEAMEKFTTYLGNYLGKIDPKNKEYYQKNSDKYLTQLSKIKDAIDDLKRSRTKDLVDVSEPVFNYALDSMGYKVNNDKFAEASENETDPTFKEINAVLSDFKEKKVAFYVQNSQTQNNTSKNILKEAKADNIPILYVTETKPHGYSYIDWQLKNYQNLKNILKK